MGLFSSLFSHKAGQVKTPGAKVVSHSVAGTNYRQEAILAMGKINPDYKLDKRGLLKRWPKGVTVYEYTFSPKKAELVPEPENPHDPKAIKVLVDGVHVGYIKAGSCAHIHKLIRENRIQKITPKIIGGKYKAVFSYDVGARSSEDFEYEKGTTPICVRLEIAEIPAPEKGKH
jgi:hypothetical protein